jgi:hypothetical protein
LTTVRLRTEDLEWREVEGEIVALDLRGSVYLSVNRTATAIWPALLNGATRGELVDRLCEAFDVDRAAAGRDVDAFLDSLRAQDLLAG